LFAKQNDSCIVRFVNKTTSANRLRVLRAEWRIPQHLAAKKAGMSHNRFWKIENGHLDPTDKERARLARLFRVGVSEVFPEAVSA
jgi:DNA-binding XRE family transcriptional regulator